MELQVRYKHRGKLTTWFNWAAALASGKVSIEAVRKGMVIAKCSAIRILS